MTVAPPLSSVIGQLLLCSRSDFFIVVRWESTLKISQQRFFFLLPNPNLMPPVGAEPAAPCPDWEWLLFAQCCLDVTGTDFFATDSRDSRWRCNLLHCTTNCSLMATEGASGDREEGGLEGWACGGGAADLCGKRHR